MNIDYFVTKGNSHKVCQDYVAPIRNKKGVALSDGCSASQNVDVGARMVVHEYPDPMEGVDRFGLEQEALNCTWLRLEILEQEKCVRFLRYGDGIMAFMALGTLYITRYEYTLNAPYYYGYKVFGDTEEYLALANNSIVRTCWSFDKNFNCLNTLTDHSYESKAPLEQTVDIPLVGLEWVGICSDGLGSFAATPKEVFREAFAFKNFHGEFVQRRMQKAMKALNNSNFDDVSIGVIHLA